MYYALFVNFNVGGDRNIQLTDGTRFWSILTAATLKAQANNARYGDASFPLSAAAADFLQSTTAGADFYAQYNGGATDYTSGGITLYAIAERVA